MHEKSADLHHRKFNRRTTWRSSEHLDRRRQPENSVEGQLQKSQRLLKVYKNYLESKLAKIRKYYNERNKPFTSEDRKYWEDSIFKAFTRAHERYLASARDILERDPKTKLLTESGFKKYVYQYIAEQHEGIFFFIDANNLKRINDDPNLGHNYGDIYLSTLAEVMTILASKYRLNVARIGGDEFGMYLTLSKGQIPFADKYTERIAKELSAKFKELWDKHKIGIKATIAIGTAKKTEFPDVKYTDEMYNILRKTADERMYTNKKYMKANGKI